MKKSVLIALLGLTTVEGLRMNQRSTEDIASNSASSKKENDTNASNATALAHNETNSSENATSLAQNESNSSNATALAHNESNASNATAFAQNESNASNATALAHNESNASNASLAASSLMEMDFVKALVEVDAKQDDLDHAEEMAQVDREAEEMVEKRVDENEDEEFAAIEAEINAEESKDATPAAAAVKDCKIEPKKNVDSSDEECACAPKKLTEKDKSKIKAKQAKKSADAKAAKLNAEKAKESAEEAIAAANLAKRTSAKNVLELAKKAETAIAQATAAEHKKIKKQSEAHQKVSLIKSERYDLRVKLAVKNWEETVVNKHELWETYKSIKKNHRIAVTNVKLVRQNVKAAENKTIQVRKTSALNPKDIGAREKINEANTLVSVLRKQLFDAESQKVKISEQMQSSQAKAREASVASAKAKAYAEKHFRNMVVDNNKVCSRCRLGKEKIAKRRLEIDGAIKQEVKLKAQREAEKRRQSRGRGGRRAPAALAQETSN